MSASDELTQSPPSFKYPTARRSETCREYCNGKFKAFDHYDWLEDPDSADTKSFVDAQNALTTPYLESWPSRDAFKKRLTELWDYPKFGCPFKRGSKYFYFHNSGLQNQSVMYVQDSLVDEPRVFLDPNTLSEDGTVALSSYKFTEDGSIFAYALSKSGSDWKYMKFMRVDDCLNLGDELERVKFSCIQWTADYRGLFYNSYPKASGKSDGIDTASNLNQKLLYHVLGTDQSQDILAAEFPEHPKWMIHAQLSHCLTYIILDISETCDPVNRLYISELDGSVISGLLGYRKIIDNFDAGYSYVTNTGTTFYFLTNNDAPNYKLITIDIANPDYEQVDVVAMDTDHVLDWAICVNGDSMVLCYTVDVKNVMYLHSLGGERLFQFPLDVGTIGGFSGRKKLSEIFYKFTSFLTPSTIYHVDLSTSGPLDVKLFRKTEVCGFDADTYETKQVFYNSLDGTKVPMFLVHRKGLKLDGASPAYLYGYGGFNISVMPYFILSQLPWLQHLGGMFAVANIRGGGEYGDKWHKDGTKSSKLNSFDDFCCAAQYLSDEGYSSADKIVLNGASNGGLLVAACANQRPDICGCVIAQVGVMDMLRFHKFTIGHAWVSDYGNPDEETSFEYIKKYSPLHNVRVPAGGGQYPAMLLLTADHDDRVAPCHSLKYTAELQHQLGDCKVQNNPIMAR